MRRDFLFLLTSLSLSGALVVAAERGSRLSEQGEASREVDEGLVSPLEVETQAEASPGKEEGSPGQSILADQAVEEVTLEGEQQNAGDLSPTQETYRRDVGALKRSALYLLIPLVLCFLVHEFIVRPKVEEAQEGSTAEGRIGLMDEESAYEYVLEEDRLASFSSLLVGLIAAGLTGNFFYRLFRVVSPKLFKKKGVAAKEDGEAEQQQTAAAAAELFTRVRNLLKVWSTGENRSTGENTKGALEAEEAGEEAAEEAPGTPEGGEGQQQPEADALRR